MRRLLREEEMSGVPHASWQPGLQCASRSPAFRMALTMLRGAPALAPGRGISSRTVHQGRAVGSSAARLQRRAAALGAVRPLAAAAASFGGEGAGGRQPSVKGLSALIARLTADACASSVGFPTLKVFPRLKERDPYRLLGVDKEARAPCAAQRTQRHTLPLAAAAADPGPLTRPRAWPCVQATYEEIQSARNFLVEEHKVGALRVSERRPQLTPCTRSADARTRRGGHRRRVRQDHRPGASLLRHCASPSSLCLCAQKLKERKRVKGIKLDKKKKDDVLISLGPLDRVRCAAVAVQHGRLL